MVKQLLLLGCLFSSLNSLAQWEVGLGPGVALPITGYGGVVKTGWLITLDGNYRFRSRWAIGMKTQLARLQNDNNPTDTFHNARMTVAPLLFTAAYRFGKGNFQPYVSGGLGISFFNINYDTSPTQGTALNNVSFTMMPLLGLNLFATSTIVPFIETGLVLLADGPPIGFPKSDQMTGYGFITAGIHYRFK